MLQDGKIWVGTGEEAVYLLPNMANRHGLVAGATGTGKTVTLKVLAEAFSDLGVPVFLGDIKGDLSGMVKPGEHSDKIATRLMDVGVPDFSYKAYPTVFWDVYGEEGHPVRTTVSEMGPLLLSRLLGLNDTQAGVLNLLFRVADDEGMLLLDIKDLKAMLAYVGENASKYTLTYGNVSKATIGAIQRAVAVLEDQGGDRFFGEPALNIVDWMQTDEEGRGNINILACDKLFLSPLMYSTFLLWMLSELFETLPEQGDLDKPRIVFFFDEAHLLFKDTSRQLMEKIEQVVRLIRSKGVGVFFVTQNPTDIPAAVLGQLGNRVQHALRAYTPQEQKVVKAVAQTFRENPKFDTGEAITQLQTGEALVSFLDEAGAPSVVTRATILPPQSYMGTIDVTLRKIVIETSPFFGVYEQEVDRESAYEYLAGVMNQGREEAPVAVQATISAPVAQQPIQAVPSQGYVVLNPQTGQYEQQNIAPVQQPIAQGDLPAQVIEQSVLVLDPTTGQYVQQVMKLQLDPATGQYVPFVSEEERKASEKKAKEEAAAQAKAEKEAAKAAKEAEAAERRAKADALRDERAERARFNDSILGRVKNTAIQTVTREVTRELSRGILGGLTGKSTKKK